MPGHNERLYILKPTGFSYLSICDLFYYHQVLEGKHVSLPLSKSAFLSLPLKLELWDLILK